MNSDRIKSDVTMHKRWIACLVSLVLASACGGGGAGSGNGARLDGDAVVEAATVDPDGFDAGAESGVVMGDAPDGRTEPVDLGALRIELTWDDRPRDLDAHLSGPDADGQDEFHVFSGNRDAGGVRLVDDATTGSGPETIEIERLGAGVYRYSVFNFSGDVDRPLDQSGARVAVFVDDAWMAEFQVPAGVGNLWTVFDVVDGQIVPVNRIVRLQNVLDYFPSSVRDQGEARARVSRTSVPSAYAFRI